LDGEKVTSVLRHQHDEMKQMANNMADSAGNEGGGVLKEAEKMQRVANLGLKME
jgi:hypothetical protein